MEEDKKGRIERIEESIKNVEKMLDKKKREIKKQKDFRLPYKSKVKGKSAKENYITVMKIDENKNVQFLKEKIIDQTVIVDNVPRLASGEFVLNYKKNPLMILPNWSVEPYSTSKSYESSLKDGSNSAGYRLLMNRMQVEVIKTAKKIGGLGIGIGALIIGGIIVYSLLTGGGK